MKGHSDYGLRLLFRNSIPCTSQGVRQGDTISPKLFTATLQGIINRLDWEDRGINIDGENLNHLRFADDIVIITDNANDLESMLQTLSDESLKCGLKMNTNKTKVMFGPLTIPRPIRINNRDIEQVDEYVYLGQNFTLLHKSQDKEIQHRLKAGWSAFSKHKDIYKGNLPMCLKRKVFNACVIPSITYGAETWTLTTAMMTKLQSTQRRMERSMLSISLKDKKTCEWIRNKTGVKDVIDIAKINKWRWAGHVARLQDNRWTKRLTEWSALYGSRKRGRPVRRWRDELDDYWRHISWTRDAQDRRKWKHHAEAFVQQWNQRAG